MTVSESSLPNAAPLSGQEKCDGETPGVTTLGVNSGGRIVSHKNHKSYLNLLYILSIFSLYHINPACAINIFSTIPSTSSFGLP